MNPRYRKYIIIISVLLHVLFLFLWEGIERLQLFVTPVVPVKTPPIVFDLQNEQKPKQVVESNAQDLKTPPKKADLLSDKNNVAQNPEISKTLPENDTFSKGRYKTFEVPKPKGVPVKPQKPEINKKSEQNPLDKQLPPIKELISPKDPEEYLREEKKQKPTPQLKPGVTKENLTLNHNQTLSQSLKRGGISFNTYKWNFAPYMLMLKSRIQSNIFPPLAFTKLGLINGISLIKFRIYPDGQLRGLVVIDYKGHQSLVDTSRNAIRISAPFPKLPADFPEDYLEVTGKFIYLINGKAIDNSN